MLKTYYKLTKPGIIMGNAITASGGFFLASRGHIDLASFGFMLLGLSLIMASGCVFNNYSDRVIDEKMARTKNRALVKGEIPVRNALVFAMSLVTCGSLVLGVFTNFLTLAVAGAGFVVYVFIYTPLKTRTTHGTLIGSISGAIPPVVGYVAVSGRLDLGSLLLLLIVSLWQMPHFFAIAMYRLSEYKAASIPVLPAVKGIYITKVQMLIYTMAFLLTSLLPTVFGYTGYAYFTVATAMGLLWLILCIKGFTAKNDNIWARKMFKLSLFVITALSIMISVDTM
ncbi:MAG: heme o synthase [Chlamydiae bacterium]|nr:heme o synthase [Chlamydiota bacterium]